MIRLKYFIFLCVFFLLGSSAFAAHVEHVHLRFEGLQNINEQQVRNVLLIKENDPFNFDKLDSSLNLLRRWGVFDVISVDLRNNELIFHLEEAEIITSISLVGNFPFIENQIRKYLSIHVGDIYSMKNLEEQEQRILEFYQHHGFTNTDVSIEEERRPESHGVDLTFHILHGDALRYRHINITGNKAFPDGRVISFINPYTNFSERRLRHALREASEFYHLNGYPKAHMKVLQKKIDHDNKRVDLQIHVDEGPKTVVKFTGNRHLKRQKLLSAVTFFREASIDPSEQEISRLALETLYRENGFPDVKIEVSKTVQKNGKIIFLFSIKEGKARHIRQIRFKGIKQGKLVKKIQSNLIHQPRKSGNKGAYQPEYIPVDSQAIQDTLIQEGYPNVQVKDWTIRRRSQSEELSVIIPIELGKQQLIHQINFKGAEHFSQNELLKNSELHINSAYSEQIIRAGMATLTHFLADHGYPYAAVSFTTQALSETEQQVDIEISEGPLVHVGQILLVGNVLTSTKAVKKAMRIREGEVFSERKVLEAELNLRRLGAFNSVNIEILGLEEKESTLHLRVKMEEQAPFLTELEFGYSTDTQYTAVLRFTNLNAFGIAKQNSLEFTAGRELSQVEIDWVDPRFLNSNVGMGLASWIRYETKRSFTYVQIAGASSWFRRYQRLGFLGRVEIDRNHFLEGDSVAADSESLRDNSLIKTTGSVSFDQRDNFADPLKGLYEIFTLEILNEIRGNNAQFAKFDWSQEYNYSPFRSITFSSSLRLNRAQVFEEHTSIPSNELYQLGGDDTVRGFDEDSLGPVDVNNDPTGARTRWIFNQELRLRSRTGLALGLFYDIGHLTDTFGELSFVHARHSAGLGLRYLTPVGPIRADYGFKLDRKPGEDRGRFHLTFGYSF